MDHYVYILECADGSYYIGVSFDPGMRLQQHTDGLGGSYTRKRRRVKLAFVELHDSEQAALQRERQLKRWTRQKKAALIAGNSMLTPPCAARRHSWPRKCRYRTGHDTAPRVAGTSRTEATTSRSSSQQVMLYPSALRNFQEISNVSDTTHALPIS